MSLKKGTKSVRFLLGRFEKVQIDENPHCRPRQQFNQKRAFFLKQENSFESCATFNLSPRFSLYFGQSYEKKNVQMSSPHCSADRKDSLKSFTVERWPDLTILLLLYASAIFNFN